MSKSGPTTRAIAGGSQNNCLLNCIAHSLFSLPEDKLAKIAKRPAFDRLMTTFQTYYGLPYKPTLDDIKTLHEKFSEPYDIEAIWGPVFRQNLLELKNMIEEDKRNIEAGKTIPDEVGAVLANSLGANISVHHDFEDAQDCIEYNANEAVFDITVYHSVRGGGHYDFDYPNDAKGTKAKKHNDTYEEVEIASTIEGQNISETIRRPIGSKIYQASKDIDDVNARKELISALLLSIATPSLDTSKEPEAVLVARRKPKPILEQKSIQESNIAMRGIHFETPKADLVRPVTEPFVELRTKKNPKSTTESVKKSITGQPLQSTEKSQIEIDPVTKFPKSFIEKLPILFPNKDWQCDLKENNLNLTHKTDNKQVSVKQDVDKDEVTFKCGKGSVQDMLLCAKAYEDSVALEYDVTYELKASSPEQAKEFMAQMKEQGLNLHQLTSVIVNGKPLQSVELDTLRESLSEEQRETSATRPRRSPN